MSLLIPEPPLQVLPSLAVKIGLNEAMFLQQVHYWLQRSGQEADGQKWVYNRVSDWQTQFPFWSEDTIARIVKNLRKSGLLVVERLSPDKRDTTNFYRIDYDLLSRISGSEPATCGVQTCNLQVCDTASCQSLLTENTTEIYISTPEQAGDSQDSKPTSSKSKPKQTPKQQPKPQGVDELVALGVDEVHATDWLRIRKSKGAAVLTETSLSKLIREAAKANLPVSDAVRIAAEKEWRGFEAAWLLENPPPPPRTPPRSPPRQDNFDKKNYGQGGKL